MVDMTLWENYRKSVLHRPCAPQLPSLCHCHGLEPGQPVGGAAPQCLSPASPVRQVGDCPASWERSGGAMGMERWQEASLLLPLSLPGGDPAGRPICRMPYWIA